MHYKIAIPVKDDIISDNFSYTKTFSFIEVMDREIKPPVVLASPLYDRDAIPAWLAEQKVTHVFARGIDGKAIEILTEFKIEVIWGVPTDKPELLVKAYLDSQLVPGVQLGDN